MGMRLLLLHDLRLFGGYMGMRLLLLHDLRLFRGYMGMRLLLLHDLRLFGEYAAHELGKILKTLVMIQNQLIDSL
jgi:hypothetical protein